ncbi:MAG: hypothetical protein ACR2JF_16800 [Iamia sp.]
MEPGRTERFAGYGVMGLPFASGHVLAMRRFPASSIGPAYTSVWHRSPEGRWQLWADRPDDQACARYFSSAAEETRQGPADLDWPDEATIRLRVPDLGLVWSATMAASVPTRALNAVASLLPDRGWRTPWVLGAMGRLAGPALRAGRLMGVDRVH